VPKKKPPTPRTLGPKPVNVMTSVAVFAESQRSSAGPTAKRLVVVTDAT
jgi:hypothetical protein